MRLMNTNYCSLDTTVVTANAEDPLFPVSNLKHPFRSKRFRSTDVDETRVVFDMITTEEIDSCVILWSKEDGVRLSDSAVIKLQANATDEWSDPSVDVTLTLSEVYEIASHYFTTDQSYRYWSILVEDSGNPFEYIELGVVWLGKSIDIENAQNGFGYDLIDRSKTVVNDFGHAYTDEYPILQSIEFNYDFLDYSAIQNLENAFRENGSSSPVMVIVDAEEDVFDKDHYAVYGRMKANFSETHIRFDLLKATGITVMESA